jgi:hypothetical protein
MEDKKRGLRIIHLEASDMMIFPITDEAKQWEKEIKKIIGGG